MTEIDALRKTLSELLDVPLDCIECEPRGTVLTCLCGCGMSLTTECLMSDSDTRHEIRLKHDYFAGITG